MNLLMCCMYHIRCHLDQEPNKEIVDCSICGSSGHPISGDLNMLESLIMKSDARYIIVIEKVFSPLWVKVANLATR